MKLPVFPSAFPSVSTSAQALQGEFMSFQGHQVHIVEKGSGPTIVLIHGLGADLTRWQANIDALAQSHRVIAIDLIGFGQSDKPDIDYDMHLFSDQVEAVLDHTDVETATLIGNSMGGLVSLHFAERHPRRVQKLVLVAPAFLYGLPHGLSMDRVALGASPSNLPAMRAYLQRIFHNPPSDALVEEELRKKLSISDAESVRSVALSLANRSGVFSRKRLATLVKPTLVIHGESDGVVPIEASRELVNVMPDARLVELATAGHWPQLEEPEAFSEAVIHHIGN